MEEGERTQKKSYSHVVSGLPPRTPSHPPSGLPPLPSRSTGSTQHVVTNQLTAQNEEIHENENKENVHSEMQESVHTTETKTTFQRNRNTLPKSRQRQGAPDIRLEDGHYSTRIITNSSRGRGSQRGLGSYRGHSYGSQEVRGQSYGSQEVIKGQRHSYAGSYDNISSQQQYKSQEQLRGGQRSVENVSGGQRSQDNISGGQHYSQDHLYQPARGYNRGSHGSYDNVNQNSREQIYHSQGHLPPTGNTRYRSRSRQNITGFNTRTQTGSWDRSKSNNNNKSSTLPRPKRSYDREPIYQTHSNSNSRPGTLPRNYKDRSGAEKKMSASGNLGSYRRISQAPSQRRISKQRESASRKHSSERRHERARSLPKQLLEPQTIFPISMSSNAIWSRDGKCPSFADMLKNKMNSGASELDVTGEDQEILEASQNQPDIDLPQTEDVMPQATMQILATQEVGPKRQQNIHANKSEKFHKSTEKLHKSNERIHQSKQVQVTEATHDLNEVKTNEAESPVMSHEWEIVGTTEIIHDNMNDDSRTNTKTSSTTTQNQPEDSNNNNESLNIKSFQSSSTSYFSEEMVVQTYSGEVQYTKKIPIGMGYVEQEPMEDDVEQDNSHIDNEFEKEAAPAKEPAKKTAVVITPPADHSSGKEENTDNKFWQSKSYANILSEGLSKVKSVFKKTKDNLKSSDESEDKKSKSAPPTPKMSHVLNTGIKLQSTPNIHPEIPGLLFKSDIERKNSKKKRRSKNMEAEFSKEELSAFEGAVVNPVTLEESIITNTDNKVQENKPAVIETEVVIKKESKTRHGQSLPREFEGRSSTSGSTNNTLRKRSKKKSHPQVQKKFNDEVDQALYEIQLMDEERAKRKSFHGSGEVSVQTLIQPKRGSKKTRKLGHSLPYQSSTDEGNAADDELEKEMDVETTTDVNSNQVTMEDIRESKTSMEKCDEVISFKSDEIMCLPEEDDTPITSPHNLESPLGITEHLSSGVDMEPEEDVLKASFISTEHSFSQAIDTIEELSSEDEKESPLPTTEVQLLSDEEKENKPPVKLPQIVNQDTVDKKEVEKKQVLDYSMGWADDDVGTMESSDDEEEVTISVEKPLALTAPKYSDIASKSPTIAENTEIQKEPPKVISIDSHHKPVIVTEEAEKKIYVEDSEGFIPARSRKKSSRTSLCEEDKQHDTKSEEAVSKKEEVVEEKTQGLDYSMGWADDDVGTMDSSEDEEEVVKSVIKPLSLTAITEKETEDKDKVTDEKKQDLDYSMGWADDDVGTMDSSEGEEEEAKSVNNPLDSSAKTEKVTEEKDKIAHEKNQGLDYSMGWADDDVGTMDSSEDEEAKPTNKPLESSAKSEKETEEKDKIDHEKNQGLDYSMGWADEDVGTMDSSDEDESTDPENSHGIKQDVHETVVKDFEEKKQDLDYSMGWADDDVGTMDSSDEEEVAKPVSKPLALTAPKYSDIASKIPKTTENREIQKEPQKVISIDSHHKTIIVTEEAEKKVVAEDSDGFILARSRKKSSRTSLCEEDNQHDTKSEEAVSKKGEVVEEKIQGLDYSMGWADDDVGTMDSSDDEEEVVKPVIKPLSLTVITEKETEDKDKVTDEKKQVLDYSMGWADDDVGTMESSDDEEEVTKSVVKPLALTAPKYSDIASKSPTISENTEIQKEPPKVISIDSHHKPVIVTKEAEKKIDVEDSEGFIPARSRKKSSRTSLCEEDKHHVTKSEEAVSKKGEVVEEKTQGLDYSMGWADDDVGTMDSSDDEEEVTISVDKSLALTAPKYSDIASKSPTIAQNTEIQKDPPQVISIDSHHKPVIVTEEAEKKIAVEDSDGFIPARSRKKSSRTSFCVEVKYQDSSSDNTQIKSEEVKEETKVEEKKQGLDYSMDWADDDVCAMESSDEENEIETKVNDAKKENSSSISTEEKKNAIEYSQDWMIEDVGTIESSDEEWAPQQTKIKRDEIKEDNNKDKKQILDYSMDWADDDVCVIESSDDEEKIETKHNEKKDNVSSLKVMSTLALTAPSYSDIASKLPKAIDKSDNLPTAPEIIALDSHHKPIIYAEEKTRISESYDSQGFTSVIRKRKKSSRVSINEETIEKHETEETKEDLGFTKISDFGEDSDSDEEIEIIDLSDDVQTLEVKDVELSCYSASCRSNGQCYSSSCPRNSNQKESVHALQNSDGRKSAMDLAQRFSMDEEDFESIEPEITEVAADETAWSFVSASGKTSTKKMEEHYMIDVKVTTKETILGHRLHQGEGPEWRMDVQCVQNDSCPDIIETTSVGVNASQKQENKSGQAPAWMRRAEIDNEKKKNEQPAIVLPKTKPVIKQQEEKPQEENENEDVYWRLKYKVKKKKRRNRSSTSQTSDLSLSGGESLTNSLKRPGRTSLLQSRSDTIDVEVGSTASSFDARDADIDDHISTSEPSIFINHPDAICIEEERRGSVYQDLSDEFVESVTASKQIEIVNKKLSSCSEVSVNEIELPMENKDIEKQVANKSYEESESATIDTCADVQESLLRMDSLETGSESFVHINVETPERKTSQFINIDVHNPPPSETMMLQATEMLRSISPQNSRQMLERQISNEMGTRSPDPNMLDATEVQRCPSPRITPCVYGRQTSREMEQATEVQRPIRKVSVNITVDPSIDDEVDEALGSEFNEDISEKSEVSSLPGLEEIMSAESKGSAYDMQKLELVETAYYEQVEHDRQKEITEKTGEKNILKHIQEAEANSLSFDLPKLKDAEVIYYKSKNKQPTGKTVIPDKSNEDNSSKICDVTVDQSSNQQQTINQFESKTASYDISKLIDAEVKYFEYLAQEAYTIKESKLKAVHDTIVNIDAHVENALAQESTEEDDYNWSDETTLLGNDPQISQDERTLVGSLPVLAGGNKDLNEDHPDYRLIGKLKVRLFDLASEVGLLEEQIKELEDLHGKSGVVEFVLKKIEDLIVETKNIEVTIEEISSERQADKQNLLVELTRARTSLIKLEGEAKHAKTELDTFMKQRRKRIEDIKMYQGILVDLEVWLEDVLKQLNADLRLTDLRIVKDQIRGCQVLEEDLRQRVDQLAVLTGNISGLTGAPDVSGLSTEMTGRLAMLREAMSRTQTGLKSRLSRLQV